MTTSTGIAIQPDAVYDDLAACSLLDVGAEVLARARREGKLRYTRLGRRLLYRGQWLLNWIDAASEGGAQT